MVEAKYGPVKSGTFQAYAGINRAYTLLSQKPKFLESETPSLRLDIRNLQQAWDSPFFGGSVF